jgi:predicted MFS family arabinose efflux permease
MALESADASSQRPSPIPRHAWSVFAILFALMVVDYVDRQVVVSMFPHLKAQWSVSDRQLASLVSIIALVVAIGTLPLSLLADRWGRAKSLFAMALVWNCATIACAYAATYDELLVARGFIGLGEAAYGSVGAALLASLFPERLRSTAIGAFLAAALVGSVLGVVVGGLIAQRWGWQAAFGAVGVPGLALALLFPLIARGLKTDHPAANDAPGGARMRMKAVVEALLKPRSLWLACAGGGLQLVMVSSTYAWLPTWLNRAYGFAPDRAGIAAGGVILAGGVGAVLCSALADRVRVRHAPARLLLPAAIALACGATMFVAFALLPPGNAQLALIVAAAAMMTGTIGPVAAAVIDVVDPSLRATATAVLTVVQNLVGLAGGAFLAGVLSDAYGLSFALSVIPLFSVAAAIVFVLAARTYVADAQCAGRDEAPAMPSVAGEAAVVARC